MILNKYPTKYPIYFFKTDTSGEKTYEEFYTEDEDYEINKYDSLGFINTPDIKISFEDVESDFEMYLIIQFSKVRYCNYY